MSLISIEMQFFLSVVCFLLQILYSNGERCDNGLFYHECLIGECCKMGEDWKCITPLGLNPYAQCDSLSQYKPTTTMKYLPIAPYKPATMKNLPIVPSATDNTMFGGGHRKEVDWSKSNDRVNGYVNGNDDSDDDRNPPAVRRLPTLAIVGIIGVTVFICLVAVVIIMFIRRRNRGNSAFGYVTQQNV